MRAPRRKPVNAPPAQSPLKREVQSRNVPYVASRSPLPSASFAALEDHDLAVPPDTDGAVGRNFLMVAVNLELRIQDRLGTNISTMSFQQFWSGLKNPTPNDFTDPRLFYDASANRFIFVVVGDPDQDTASVLIAVSQTEDPTGNWNLFQVDADPDNAILPDYPSVGYNKDWIVVSLNMFSAQFGFFDSVNIYVFDKAALYANTAAKFTLVSDNSGFGFTIVPAVTFDDTLDTMYLLEDYDSGSGQLRLNTISGPIGSEILTLNAAFPSSPDAWLSFGDPAPQAGSDKTVDSGDSRIQNVVYRNGSLWCTHTVFLPYAPSPNHAAIQWWQIQPNGVVTQRGRIDDPTGATFYMYPSIAVNKDNDALIGFSRASASQYISANYVFRRADDPAGTTRADIVLKAGEAPYSKGPDEGFGSRWGDYSTTMVDPLNDTDMWTIQEYAATPINNVDKWGTWWGKVAPADTGTFVTVSTPDNVAAEPGKNTGTFMLTRTNRSGQLTVNYQVSGTAVSGTDFEALSGTAVFDDGTGTIDIIVKPINNKTLDLARNVILSIVPGTGYQPGTPSVGVITIDDDETIKITSGPTATPNPAITGLSIVFTVAVDSPDIDEVFWDFGDGTTDDNKQLTVTHAYNVAGSYQVLVAIFHKGGSVAIGTLQIDVDDDSDRDGIPDMLDDDDDNDGFPDAIEDALNTDPLDRNDTPTGAPANAPLPITIKRFSAKLDFARFFNDSLSLSGTIPIEAGPVPSTLTAVIDVGGVAQLFTLDSHGRGKFGRSSAKFTLKTKDKSFAKQTSNFSVKFSNGDFLSDWEDEGISDADTVKNEPHTFNIYIFINDTMYMGTRNVKYSAKPFASGTLK